MTAHSQKFTVFGVTADKYPRPDAFRKATRERVDEIVRKALAQGNGKCEIPNDDAWIVPDVVKDLEALGYSVYFAKQDAKRRSRTLHISLSK